MSPSHAVYSGEVRNSLTMSAEEAGGVFHKAQGRTLDAFSAGTASSSPGAGGVFRAAERFAGGTFSSGARTSSRILWGLHPGVGDHNKRTTRLWGSQGRCGEKNVALGVWS